MQRTNWILIGVGILLVLAASFAFEGAGQAHVIYNGGGGENETFKIILGILGLGLGIFGIIRTTKGD